MTSRPLRVFLCHASQDKPAVRELYQKLRAEAWIQPWLDEEELYPGDDWDLEIEKAVENSDVVLVCLSNGSINKKGYVQKELRFALDIALEIPEEEIFIIPLRLEECTPPRSLRDWHYADYFEGQRERALERLLVSLKRRADSLGLKLKSIVMTKGEKSDGEKMLIFDPESGELVVKTKETETSASEEKTPAIRQTTNFDQVISMEPIFETQESGILHADWINANKITLFNGMEFMRVPAGKYIAGNKEQRDIEIPYDYWMGRFPVTNELYYQYVKSKSINHPVSNWMKKKDHPVAFVSWFDAVDYSNWLNLQCKNNLPDGKLLRLPISFEWEKAARGLDGRSYPWGNEFDKDKCNSWEGGGKGTTPVGAYSPIGDSPFGCSDMWGNIRVWAQEVAKVRIPEIPDNVDIRVTCGISYNNAGSHPISMNSFGEISEHKSRVGGFRLVIAPPLPK